MARLVASLLAILILLAAAACLLFGMLYFAGVKSDVADKYGASGKVFSWVITLLTVPLFNLGRFIARKGRRSPEGDPS